MQSDESIRTPTPTRQTASRGSIGERSDSSARLRSRIRARRRVSLEPRRQRPLRMGSGVRQKTGGSIDRRTARGRPPRKLYATGRSTDGLTAQGQLLRNPHGTGWSTRKLMGGDPPLRNLHRTGWLIARARSRRKPRRHRPPLPASNNRSLLFLPQQQTLLIDARLDRQVISSPSPSKSEKLPFLGNNGLT